MDFRFALLLLLFHFVVKWFDFDCIVAALNSIDDIPFITVYKSYSQYSSYVLSAWCLRMKCTAIRRGLIAQEALARTFLGPRFLALFL